MTENTMEKKGNFWQELTQSFNPNFYRLIVSQSFGRSLRYIILLALFVATVLTVRHTADLKTVIVGVAKWGTTDIPQILSDIPTITIENGKVSCAAQQPFVKIWDIDKDLVKKMDLDKDRVTFIIDTTGQITSLDGYDNGLLLTKNKLIIKSTEAEGVARIREHDLSKVDYFKLEPGKKSKGEIVNITLKRGRFSLTYNTFAKWLKILWWVAIPIMLIFFFVYYIFAKIVQLFVFSPLALLIAKFAKTGISYSKLLNIGAYAFTAPTLLAALCYIIKLNIPILWLLYISLYVSFLIMAIRKCKNSLMAEGEQIK